MSENQPAAVTMAWNDLWDRYAKHKEDCSGEDDVDWLRDEFRTFVRAAIDTSRQYADSDIRNLKAKVDRLRRERNKWHKPSITLCLPVAGDPFRRMDCVIDDVSYSEAGISISCPEAEAEMDEATKAIGNEARLRGMVDAKARRLTGALELIASRCSDDNGCVDCLQSMTAIAKAVLRDYEGEE